MNKSLKITDQQNPCWNCKRRSIYCHGNCEDYMHFLKVNNEIKKRAKNDALSHVESSSSWCWDHRGVRKD